MGEIRSNVTLENTGDRVISDRGQGRETDIRRTSVDGMVDTGAVSLVLPQEIVEDLGLDDVGSSVGYRPSTSRQDPGLVGFRRAGHAPRRGTAPGIPPKDLDNGCNWQPPPRRPRAVRTGHALARKTARQAAAPAGNRSACVP